MDKEYLIRFILIHSPTTDRKKLELMSFEELVILKVQLEVDLNSGVLKRGDFLN